MEDLRHRDAGRFLRRLLLALLILLVIAQGSEVFAHSAQGFAENVDAEDN